MAGGADTSVDGALALIDAVHDAPAQVATTAAELLADAGASPEVHSVAARAAAMAARELGQGHDAVRHARRAATLARRAGSPAREAEARTTLGLCLFELGRTAASLAELARAARLAPDDGVALRADAQRAVVLERLGRIDEAIAGYESVLERRPPPFERAFVLNNLAIALTFRGRALDAVAPMTDALETCRSLGRPVLVSHTLHNLGFVLALAGELPAALARFDEADALAGELGLPLGPNLVARTRALLLAGLVDEAAEAAAAAVAALRADGARADEAEALVLLAEARLALGELHEARTLAGAAQRRLRAQGRPALAARARYVAVRARTTSGERSQRLLAVATEAVDALGGAGLVDDELDARLVVAQVAAARGEPAVAAQHLRVAAGARRSPISARRARGWLAEGRRRALSGDPRGAERAAAAGIDTILRWQRLAGASDLRAGMAGHATALVSLGLDVLVGRGDAEGTLRWLGRGRTLSMTGAAGGDAALAEDLRAVRAAAIAVAAADAAGTPAAGARAELARLEREARARARHAQGASRTRRPPRAAAPTTEPGRVALHYFVRDGWVGAVRVDAGGPSLHPRLVRADRVAAAVEGVRVALRRLGRRGSPAALAAARAALDHDAALLDPLVAPLVPGAVGAVTLGPTGVLFALPWSVLPSLRERAWGVVVAPAPERPATVAALGRRGRAVVVAGPDLPAAEAEAVRVASHHRRATVLAGPAATCDAVLAALDGAAVAHLVCHGRLRAENPQFSALALADGPLHVYDLEGLARPPALVVLSACDVGSATVRAGDELLGLTAALLRQGSRVVVAAPVPVPDEPAVAVMAAFHAALDAGEGPAAALAAARAAVEAGDVRAAVAADAFVCLSR